MKGVCGDDIRGREATGSLNINKVAIMAGFAPVAHKHNCTFSKRILLSSVLYCYHSMNIITWLSRFCQLQAICCASVYYPSFDCFVVKE